MTYILEALRRSGSLLARHLDPEVLSVLSSAPGPSGFTLEDVVRSGLKNLDSHIGVYLGGPGDYDHFSALLDPIIAECHGVATAQCHRGDRPEPRPVGKFGKRVLSTRIRIARNLASYNFTPAISKTDRLEVESQVTAVLSTLPGDLAGDYQTWEDACHADQVSFPPPDRFLTSAGGARDWPSGRGTYRSADGQFIVRVNEEDHLRIISMQPGGDIGSVFERLEAGAAHLKQRLGYAWHDRLGYLTACPTNLGSGMRASVHVQLSELEESGQLTALCDALGLSVRGIHGEHSDSVDGVVDISNKQRLGISCAQVVDTVGRGVRRLIDAAENCQSPR